MTTGLTGRDDILIDAIAHNDDLIWFQSQRLNTKREDTGIGLAYAHHGRLDDLGENAIEAKLAKYGLDVTIEVADKHHRILFFQT